MRPIEREGTIARATVVVDLALVIGREASGLRGVDGADRDGAERPLAIGVGPATGRERARTHRIAAHALEWSAVSVGVAPVHAIAPRRVRVVDVKLAVPVGP